MAGGDQAARAFAFALQSEAASKAVARALSLARHLSALSPGSTATTLEASQVLASHARTHSRTRTHPHTAKKNSSRGSPRFLFALGQGPTIPAPWRSTQDTRESRFERATHNMEGLGGPPPGGPPPPGFAPPGGPPPAQPMAAQPMDEAAMLEEKVCARCDHAVRALRVGSESVCGKKPGRIARGACCGARGVCGAC